MLTARVCSFKNGSMCTGCRFHTVKDLSPSIRHGQIAKLVLIPLGKSSDVAKKVIDRIHCRLDTENILN